MKVLVTGGNGFIGTYVRAELKAQGHESLSFDHHAKGGIRRPDSAILGDVRDATSVTDAAARVDAIIHLAAILGTQETIANPRPAAEVNVMGSLNVFEAATQYDLPMVYIGVGNHWMREHGGGSYTITKTCAEDFARTYRKHRGTKITVVRPVNAYGRGQSVAAPFGSSKVRKILPSFICRALSGMPIEVYGSGDQVSDMVHVTDVAKVLVKAIGHSEIGPIEVGPVLSATVNDIADMVRQRVWDTTMIAAPITHLPMRPGEVPEAKVTADTKTLDALGIDPWRFTPLISGISDTVDYYLSEKGRSWHPPA